MNPLVSIIIPAYNSEKWIADTILSVLNQTWKNTEIIVVDDGSTDNTFRIAQSFASNNVLVITQKNKGASAARNTGLAKAKGDYIQFLDADDLLAKDKIEVQLMLATRFGPNYLYSSAWGIFTDSTPEPVFTEHFLWKDYDSPIDYLVTSWTNKIWMVPFSYFISRDIAVKAGNWNETISRNDDGEYFCRVVLASKGIRFSPNAIGYYRRGNATSLSSLIGYKYALSDLKTYELNEKYIRQVEDSAMVRKACAANYQKFVYLFYPNYPDLIKLAEKHIQRLGGSELLPFIPESYIKISKIVGWKLAKRLELWAYENSYSIKKVKQKLINFIRNLSQT